MPLLCRGTREQYRVWRRICHIRSRRQKNRAWHARRGFGPSRSEPGLTSELVELKSVERILPIHKAQLLSYMKLLKVPVGLLINFHEPVLKGGITRLMRNTHETRE